MITKDEDEYTHRMRRDIESEAINGNKVWIHLTYFGSDVVIEECNSQRPTWNRVAIRADTLDDVIEFLQKVKKDLEGKE